MTSERKSDPLAAAEMDALIGHTVGGRFKITGRIARGGMACVYSATQGQLNRPVAIKVLRSSITGGDSSAEFRRRFLQEASMLSRLQHPNLVTLLDYGQITELPGDHYFIAMEYLQGETLARRFRTQGPLGVAQSIRIARQIGRGLRETHRQGFVHRDLKPSNIMLVPEEGEGDIVKLIDFGIGKVVEPSAREPANEDEQEMTRVGLLLGSPRYMAPEQIRGDAVEPRTDLYGLGIILFQALTGRLPFEHKSDVDTMLAHCRDAPPPLDAYVEEPTGALPELVADLLKKQPAERPTVHDFLARLANVEGELFDSLGVAGPTLSGPRPSYPPHSGRTSSRPPLPPPRPTRSGAVEEPPSLQELAGLVRGRSEPPTVVTTGSFGSLARAPDVLAPAAPQSFALAPMPPSTDALLVAPVTAPPPRPGRGKALVGLFFLVLAGALVWLGLRSSSEPTAAAPPATSTASPKARASFRLKLDSMPSEAVVKEGELVLGKTPLELEIQRASVSTGPRQFVVEREGFRSFTHAQGDSTVDIATIVPLEANAAAARAPRSRKREVAAGAAAAAEKPAAPPARPSERLDINLAR